MNLKEFDAKQFLLEKGERVGLGVAVTLTVLILVLSLFMPSKGFFSGSPAKNAEVLDTGAASLERALQTAEPSERDKPGKTEGHLIKLDTRLLQLDPYALTPWFEATRSETPSRRPPTILNVDETVVWIGAVPIDTYIFVGRDFSKMVMLKEPGGKAPAGPQGAGGNAMSRFMQQFGRGGASAPPAGGVGASQYQRQMSQFRNNANMAGGRIQGGEEKPEYDTVTIPVDRVDSSTHLARQLRPLRMAILAASFPYKAQLTEFKNKLRRDSIQDVLNEEIDDGKEKLPAFRFLGVEVERMEVDATGKKVTDWGKLDVNGSYELWMQHSGLPFEPDDPKYDPIKPVSVGLMMPRLRQFREEGTQLAAMMGPMPGAGVPPGRAAAEPPPKEAEPKYPDVEGKLKEIAETLDKLTNVSPKQVAAPPSRFRPKGLNVFNPDQAPVEDKAPAADDKADLAGGPVVPDYCLMRLVDVTIEPGKYYRYRVKVRMANPNYGRSDVASVAYKADKELVSDKWVEFPQTVTTPPEMVYYVVDQKHVTREAAKEKVAKDTALYDMWMAEPSSRDRQVVMQFHRWVESNPIVPDGEPVPVGEWSVAERVIVARGEYVGRPVKVDLPVWKYTQDSFVLPAEDQKKKVRGKVRTGVTVNFGQDNPDNETILVDFEGGPRTYEEPVPEGAKPNRTSEVSAYEVLMMTADGRLLARNSAVDTADEERENRRKKVRERIQEVREGKNGGAAPAGGGGGLDRK